MKASTTRMVELDDCKQLSQQDVTEPDNVEVRIRSDSKVLWVNINGICVLRCCRIKELTIEDERGPG